MIRLPVGSEAIDGLHGDLALDDFQEGEIGLAQAGAAFDESNVARKFSASA